MRYIVRTYALSEEARTAHTYTQEFVFTKDVANGYDHAVTLDVLPGNYKVMVWADMVEQTGTTPFYNADNFAEIALQGKHQGNTNHRDAFCGVSNLSLVSDIVESAPDTLDITMQRPLAKVEFITNDVVEFIDKEMNRIVAQRSTDAQSDTTTRLVNIEDYKVVFYYVGFMPNAYNIFSDNISNSASGVLFESTLKKLHDTKASLGFDYVFAYDEPSTVAIRIALYDTEGVLLSLSKSINTPVKRNYHTIVCGEFLMMEATGGVAVDPGFDGDHNLIFP